jgi:hypothetical protein
MKPRLIALLVLGALIASSAVAFARPKHAPTVVAKDSAGDWGADIDPALGPVGEALGQDLVSASIVAHPDTIDFSLATTSLPAEAARAGAYVWDMRVDKTWWRLSSFVCDPSEYVSATPAAPASCAPDGPGVYFEVLECGTARLVNISANCSFRAAVESVVDTAAATITVPVPSALIGAKPGTLISPMDASASGAIVSGPVFPYGGSTVFPGDGMTWTKAFRVR